MAKTIERTILGFIIKETCKGILQDMGKAAGQAALGVLSENMKALAEPAKKKKAAK